jgi:hypothetical protein
MWKETVVAYLKIFFRHLPGSTEDNIEKFPSNRCFPEFALEALSLATPG